MHLVSHRGSQLSIGWFYQRPGRLHLHTFRVCGVLLLFLEKVSQKQKLITNANKKGLNRDYQTQKHSFKTRKPKLHHLTGPHCLCKFFIKSISVLLEKTSALIFHLLVNNQSLGKLHHLKITSRVQKSSFREIVWTFA